MVCKYNLHDIRRDASHIQARILPAPQGSPVEKVGKLPDFLTALTCLQEPLDPSDSGGQKGNTKGAQWEPSPVTAAHPSDPGAQKGEKKHVDTIYGAPPKEPNVA